MAQTDSGEYKTPTHIIRSVGLGTAVVNIDAATKTTRTWQNSVTSHPLEDGSNVSDHVTTSNPQFTISGIISDAVVMSSQKIQYNDPGLFSFLVPSYLEDEFSDYANGSASVSGNVGAFIVDKTQSAKLLLQKISQDRELVTVVFKLEEYPNCVLTRFKIDKDKSTGDALNVDLTFEQLTFITSAETQINIEKAPDVEKKAADNTSGGSKPAESKAVTVKEKSSFLYRQVYGG
jgi:hypothetical protein